MPFTAAKQLIIVHHMFASLYFATVIHISYVLQLFILMKWRKN